MRRAALVVALVALPACKSSSTPEACGSTPWLQFGHDSSHSGSACVAAQPPARELARLSFDPFVAQEKVDGQGDLNIHYQVPLVVGGDVYMEVKGGTYTPCQPAMPPAQPKPVCALYRWDTETWSEKRFTLEGGALVEQWTFDSDWKPAPTSTFEPFFQPVITGGTLWVPGGGGSVHRVDRVSGKSLGRVQPFGATLDPDTYVAGGLAADAAGNVFYDVIKLDHAKPAVADALGWLVVVAPGGTFRTVSFATIVPGAPAATDLCELPYSEASPAPPMPWPPKDPMTGAFMPAPTGPCGSQRPSFNVTPAVGPDGTIYTVSRAHGAGRYAYVVAMTPDLKPKWARSLRGILNDGCGVRVPDDGDPMLAPTDCTPGAPMGVDPATNSPPAAIAFDDGTASPVVLPDGSVLYGGYTKYNAGRGHLFKLDPTGAVTATYDFGWDVTPAVWRHDGTYSIVIKDNHYGTDANGADLGPYSMTQLSSDLKVEWQFVSTNTQSCTRGADGQVTCVADHPHGFEWCINAPAVDLDGTVYVNSEDGNAYAILQGGQEKAHLFLDSSGGSAYTPVALDEVGLVYALNFGSLSVLGR